MEEISGGGQNIVQSFENKVYVKSKINCSYWDCVPSLMSIQVNVTATPEFRIPGSGRILVPE